MLTRRRFVQALGAGTAAAYASSWIGARGRENSVWSAFEPTLEAVEPGVLCLSSNENPLGPGQKVLDAVKAAFGPAGAAPGRYSSAAGGLVDAIAKHFNIKSENV
ncbi:MAG TPA: twin-arginine translocation signal domain-containing protein, partial [Thermoanaerobaculia bacterium]|nr:twin-arginine translocation signal domain-containing protein [Thermoanaerobaculia bacterium]